LKNQKHQVSQEAERVTYLNIYNIARLDHLVLTANRIKKRKKKATLVLLFFSFVFSLLIFLS
jgi:hypothetical protein